MSSSNIVTIVRNTDDTQVEINGREVPDVIEVHEVMGINGGHKVALVFMAAQVNIVGVNAVRDAHFIHRDNGPQSKRGWWQRFKAWWQRTESAFEDWQNGKRPGDDY